MGRAGNCTLVILTCMSHGRQWCIHVCHDVFLSVSPISKMAVLAELSPQQDPEFQSVEMICEHLPTNSMVSVWSRHRTARHAIFDAGLSDVLRRRHGFRFPQIFIIRLEHLDFSLRIYCSIRLDEIYAY